MLDAHTRLGILQPREHAHLLGLELVDFPLEAHQVLLRLFRLAGEFLQFVAKALAIGGERLLALDQQQCALILVEIGSVADLLINLAYLGGLLLQFAFELTSQIDDAGCRAFKLLIAANTPCDRSFVDALGIASLAVSHPAATLAADEIKETPEHGCLLKVTAWKAVLLST